MFQAEHLASLHVAGFFMAVCICVCVWQSYCKFSEQQWINILTFIATLCMKVSWPTEQQLKAYCKSSKPWFVCLKVSLHQGHVSDKQEVLTSESAIFHSHDHNPKERHKWGVEVISNTVLLTLHFKHGSLPP